MFAEDLIHKGFEKETIFNAVAGLDMGIEDGIAHFMAEAWRNMGADWINLGALATMIA